MKKLRLNSRLSPLIYLNNCFIFVFVLVVTLIVNGFLFSKVSAATIIETDILENSTWTKEASPYVIKSPALVPEGVTLTIEPGTIVKFDSGASLTVDGVIKSNGTETDPIYFTSFLDDTIGGDTNNDNEATVPSQGDWDYLLIESKTSSILNYTFEKYSGNGLILYSGGSVTSDHFNSDQGIISIGSKSSFSDLVIPSLELYDNSQIIVDLAVISNTNDLLVSVENNSSLILNQTKLNGQSNTLVDIFKNSTATFNNVEITGDDNISTAIEVFDNSNLNINGSTISNNFNGFEIYNSSSLSSTGLSLDCGNNGISVFNKSSLQLSGGNISCFYDDLALYDEVNAHISNVKITKAMDAGVTVYYNNDSNIIDITKSEITDNQSGFVVYDSPIKVNENSIHGNYLNGVDTFSSVNLDFTSNYWGKPSGPTHPSNPNGTGDIISDNILYQPFLTSDPLSSCCSSVLFIPGFEGSRLYKPDYNGGTTKLWEPNGNDDQAKNLLMDTNGIATREDIYTKDIINNAYLIGDIYKSFINQLDQIKNNDHIINDYSIIPYDWRLSIDDILNNGDKNNNGQIYYSGLLGQTPNPYIISELRKLASKSNTGKVTIVAHSNGGLVAKELTNKLGLEASKLIDKIIFVGVPQIGTPQAIGALLHGFGQALPNDYFSFLGISKLASRDLGQNMPGAYNLLPSSPYFTYIDNPVITFDNSAMLAPWRLKYGSIIHSRETLKNFLIDSTRINMPTSNGLDSPIILNSILLNKSDIIHNNIDNWVPPDDVKLIEIAGWGVPTVGTVQYYQGQKTDCNIFLKCSNSPILQYNPNTFLDGDGTVLTPSALWTPISNNVKKYWLDLKDYNDPLLTINRSHVSLFEVPQLREFIKNIITNNIDSPIDYILSSSPQNPNDETQLHFLLHSPLSFDLYDNNGNHTGISKDTNMIEENIPGSYYKTFGEVKFISVPISTKLHLSMKGYDSGSFTLDIEKIRGDKILDTTTFAAVPTFVDTVATLDIFNNMGAINISSLSVDENNDGISDITLIPKIGGIVIPDFTPPEPIISIDSETKDLKIESPEDNIKITKDLNNYIITDKSGNTTKLFFKKKYLGKLLTYAKLLAIQYNKDNKINIPDSSFVYLWNVFKNPQMLISQTIIVNDTSIIESMYDEKKNITLVFLKKKGLIVQKKVFTGLHISKLTLNKNIIGYEL